MSEDWKPGDLAVCVIHGEVDCPSSEEWAHTGKSCPPKGLTVRVVSVRADEHWGDRCGCIALYFEGGFAATSWRCRKVRPDQHEPCEEEFTALLKRSKRPVRA